MTNLGKIFILFFLTLSLAKATFTVSVSATSVSQGDEVVLTFTSDVSPEFPVIHDIAGVEISQQSRESSTSYINGKKTGSYKKHFFFLPSQSMTIPAYTMKEHGREVKSKPINIKVTKAKQDQANDDLFFQAYLSKKEVMVGEPFFVTLVYKQAKDLDVVDRRLTQPTGQHFWIEKKPIESSSSSATHLNVEIKYVFTAHKAGKLSINPANIKVGEAAYLRDAWGNLRASTRYKTLFSDTLQVNVKPLPQGVENVGDFKLNVSVDKKKSNEKDAVNLTISIEGEGNIADIPAFALPLQGVLVYDEKPNKEHQYKNGHYEGAFTQKFAIVSDHNYTIPALSFSFYDLKKRKSITLRSKAINIEIKPTATASKVKTVTIEKAPSALKEESPVQGSAQSSWLTSTVILLFGMFLGWALTKIKTNFSQVPARHKINLKGEKALLQALMPYAEQDKEAKAFVETLCSNIYDKTELAYDKKALEKVLKRLKIKD